jgi:hypothetical protein
VALEEARSEVAQLKSDKDSAARTLKVFRENAKETQLALKRLKAEQLAAADCRKDEDGRALEAQSRLGEAKAALDKERRECESVRKALKASAGKEADATARLAELRGADASLRSANLARLSGLRLDRRRYWLHTSLSTLLRVCPLPPPPLKSSAYSAVSD